MELEHFSHEHPLKLIDEAQSDKEDEKILCDGCRESIESSAYSCTECKYNLHKKCAELPKEFNHPMHVEHSLTLHSHPPYRSFECFCNVCRISGWKWFTYNCSICEFDIHVSCILEESMIKHEGHPDTLMLVERPALFECDACNTEKKDTSYRCTKCSFWIHKSCAKLPTTITLCEDNHPLELAFSLPNIYRNFRHKCKICRKKVHPSHWVYYCALCRYFVHPKCATVEKQPLPLSAEAYIDPSLMNFPLTDNSVDVISQFVESMRLEGTVHEIARELTHFSHHHPLTLFEAQSDYEMINEEMQCDGCNRQILSVPFYSCSRGCNFYVHRCCIELPEEITQHPYHPEHPLSLYKFTECFKYIKCNYCTLYSNGFFYWCWTCKLGLCVHCSCLPRAINHDAHNHSLKLETNQSYKGICSGCGNVNPGPRYQCEACDFNIDNYCLTLPRTVKHDWDDHLLTLSYPPFSYHPDEFLCEFCEEFIHPSYSLYHCRVCNHSFHTRCIKPFDWYSNVKFGGTVQFENHPHPRVHVRKSKNKSPSICSQCGQSRDRLPVIECAPCNFQLCIPCNRDIYMSKFNV